MRLFVSYARVDKSYCKQVVDLLDVHEVWYDRRLHAGQHWWDEILHHLAWCDGFIYLLSRESVTSEYCQREFAIAQQLTKHIFPVLIHDNTAIPESLKAIQYADLSKGLDARSVKQLLNSIYLTEREGHWIPEPEPVAATHKLYHPLEMDDAALVGEAAEALDEGDFDRAVFLLKHAAAHGYKSRFLDLNNLLVKAEAALEQQAQLREAEREYNNISSLVKCQSTFKVGCVAFMAFREDYPDYDPENLAAVCLSQAAPIVEWCAIPSGEVYLERGQRRTVLHVEDFRISKYPITNAQYQLFVTAPDGYDCPRWWSFSQNALAWHQAHPKPLPSRIDGAEYPRTNVCWYEAVAFCFWLSEKTGKKISLPTEQQWQRAAQGDSRFRYPWGDKFDPERCNTRESDLKKPTPVTYYPSGISPYGVYDMSGNAWEWCLTKWDSEDRKADGGSARVLRGGSFTDGQDFARTTFRIADQPDVRINNLGFRVAYVASST